MEKQIYEDKDYKENYDKVVKALSNLKPLQDKILNFKALNIVDSKQNLDNVFLEILKYLTTTSRRYVLDYKVRLDKDKETPHEICVNENGLGYIGNYNTHCTSLLDEYYLDRLLYLFINKDAVLGISQLIKKDNRVEFLKVVDLFVNCYANINDIVGDAEKQNKSMKVNINDGMDRIVLQFDNHNTLNRILIDGLVDETDDTTSYNLYGSGEILNLLNDKDYENIIRGFTLSDFIIINTLVEHQQEFIKMFDNESTKESMLLEYIKRHKQIIEDKLKPLKVYEKL